MKSHVSSKLLFLSAIFPPFPKILKQVTKWDLLFKSREHGGLGADFPNDHKHLGINWEADSKKVI